MQQVRFSKDIGEIYKVRLGFDDYNDSEENWLLDAVRISCCVCIVYQLLM